MSESFRQKTTGAEIHVQDVCSQSLFMYIFGYVGNVGHVFVMNRETKISFFISLQLYTSPPIFAIIF